MSAHTTTARRSGGGIGAWLAASDHHRVAIVQLVSVVFALLLGGTFALVMHLEHLAPTKSALGPDVYAQMSTVHGFVMIVLCALPALGMVFGNLLLPGLVGAADLALPSLSRWSLRAQLWALALAVVALLMGAVDTGWTLLPTGVSGLPVLALAIAMHLMALALIMTGLNHIATVVQSEGEPPLLARMFGLGGLAQVLGAVLLGACAILLFSAGTGRAAFFSEATAILDYASLFAFFARTAVLIVAIPAVGLIFDIAARAARKEPHAPGATVLATGLTAVLVALGNSISMGWQGSSLATQAAGSAFGLLALVPASIVVSNLILTLHEGAIRISSALLFALSGVVSLVMAGMAGLFLAALSTGSYLQGTTFGIGFLHYVFVGGGLSTLAAALYAWWPRIAGRKTKPVTSAWALIFFFAGTHLCFLPQLILGARGTATRLAVVDGGSQALTQMSAIGGLVLGVGIALVIVDFLQSLTSGEPTEEDCAA